MARFTRLFFSLAHAFALAPLLFIGETVSFVGRTIVDLYQPTARESLALDRLVEPVAILPARHSRFMAFIDSARTHADFSAGHFDPGRMAA
ncbi:hypothetical protein [Devosia sp. Root635]|uniref:hypothetical protein n=1 Tax=Devosia sp. Root635 TaxID=1736575 RepID=UPI00070184E2|nr:hypothetical protein [Devosia sp. Root635]KRA42110.1 hypothetical protein ASD80_10315 [Devosia sp. Root635]